MPLWPGQDVTQSTQCFQSVKCEPRNFFSRAQERLRLNVPVEFADPSVIPPARPARRRTSVVAALAAVRPIRLSAVLVPIIVREEASVLFTQRTAHLHTTPVRFRFPAARSTRVTRATPRPHYRISTHEHSRS